MTISIEDADRKIRDLAALTGEPMTVAMRISIEQRLRRESARRSREAPARRFPHRDRDKALRRKRSNAIGYDENGLPR